MKKVAKKLTPEEYAAARRLLGLPEFDDTNDYGRYLEGRSNNYKLNMGFDAATLGALGAALGSAAGPAGAIVGGLAGGGTGMLTGAGWAKLFNYLQDRQLRRYAKDYEQHAMAENVEKDEEEDDKQEKKSEMRNNDVANYKEGFVKQCSARGVDPRYAAKVAAWMLQKSAEAERRQKQAAAVFRGLDPYMQGFIVRCNQRGVPTAKVAEFCKKAAAKKAK